MNDMEIFNNNINQPKQIEEPKLEEKQLEIKLDELETQEQPLKGKERCKWVCNRCGNRYVPKLPFICECHSKDFKIS